MLCRLHSFVSCLITFLCLFIFIYVCKAAQSAVNIRNSSPPIDVIWAVMIVWRIRRKVIRTVAVLYCVLQLYIVICKHKCAVPANVPWPAGLVFFGASDSNSRMTYGAAYKCFWHFTLGYSKCFGVYFLPSTHYVYFEISFLLLDQELIPYHYSSGCSCWGDHLQKA